MTNHTLSIRRVVEELLGNRDALLTRIDSGTNLLPVMRGLIICVLLACAVFGAALGMFRGGGQVFFAAIKMPIVVLLTACVCAPVLTAFNAALGREARLTKDLSLTLAGLAFASLVLLGQTPLLLVADALGIEYHALILLVSITACLAATSGVVLVFRGMRKRQALGAMLAPSSMMMVMMIVFAQMAWTFRPYVVRPQTKDVPVVRAIDGNFVDAIRQTLRSARGHYDESPSAIDALWRMKQLQEANYVR